MNARNSATLSVSDPGVRLCFKPFLQYNMLYDVGRGPLGSCKNPDRSDLYGKQYSLRFVWMPA